jgi:hypothetical protein
VRFLAAAIPACIWLMVVMSDGAHRKRCVAIAACARVTSCKVLCLLATEERVAAFSAHHNHLQPSAGRKNRLDATRRDGITRQDTPCVLEAPATSPRNSFAEAGLNRATSASENSQRSMARASSDGQGNTISIWSVRRVALCKADKSTQLILHHGLLAMLHQCCAQPSSHTSALANAAHSV